MQSGKLSRWLGLGLVLNISIVIWRFWAISDDLITLLPYRTVTDWTSDPPIWLIFYGLGFVGVRMAVTGDRRPLLFWNVCYLVILVPGVVENRKSIELLLQFFPSNLIGHIHFLGAVIATLALYIGDRRMRREHRTSEAALLN